jgi:hypothetical protein
MMTSSHLKNDFAFHTILHLNILTLHDSFPPVSCNCWESKKRQQRCHHIVFLFGGGGEGGGGGHQQSYDSKLFIEPRG